MEEAVTDIDRRWKTKNGRYFSYQADLTEKISPVLFVLKFYSILFTARLRREIFLEAVFL